MSSTPHYLKVSQDIFSHAKTKSISRGHNERIELEQFSKIYDGHSTNVGNIDGFLVEQKYEISAHLFLITFALN